MIPADRSRLGRRLARIERELKEIKSLLSWPKPKRAMSFEEALPPYSVCQDALSKVENTTSYAGLLSFLSSYYGVPLMRFYHDERKIPQRAIAAYYSDEDAAYCRNPIIDRYTVLHEFFHHLVAYGVIMAGKEDREKQADDFANIVLARGRR